MIKEMIEELEELLKINYSQARGTQNLAIEKSKELDDLIREEKKIIDLLDIQFKKYEELLSLVGERVSDDFHVIRFHVKNKKQKEE